MVEKAICAMIEYLGTDHQQVHHALQVYTLARAMALREGVPPNRQEALECAAILNNIGISESMRVFGSTLDNYQAFMSGKVAGELLQALAFPREMIDDIQYLIHRCRSATPEDETALQILLEADCLAELLDSHEPPEYERCFHTRTGLEFLHALCDIRPPLLSKEKQS